MAQEQGYFKEINFHPLWEFDQENGDTSIAKAAVDKLEEDLKAGYNHIILVRAKDMSSANHLFKDIYLPLYEKYKPVLIHSGVPAKARNDAMISLKKGNSRIVVCVDMFGEGIDIPNLKIAAVHDKYKSLPITLQFIGRFARSKEGLGEATLITNIANDDLMESLRELYAQDSDWNILLHVFSEREIDREISLQKITQGFDNKSLMGIDISQFRLKISMTAYSSSDSSWQPKALLDLFDSDNCCYTVNNDKGIIIVIEKLNTSVEWTSYKGITDTNWNLHIIYWNPLIMMFFVNSTNKTMNDNIAAALFSHFDRVRGEKVFRCLHGINRLMLGTVGLKSAIDGPIRYRMFAGIDIAIGIVESQKETSMKSNLFGIGYSGKGKVSIGCSYKGRIWSRWNESIDFWMQWCNDIASKLQNSEIDTSKIFEGALIPEIIKERPVSVPYAIEWPIELDLLNDSNVYFKIGQKEYPVFTMDIKLANHDENGPIQFNVLDDSITEKFEFRISEQGTEFSALSSKGLTLKMNKIEYSMTEFFSEYPPRIKFIDQSTLEGNYLVKITASPPPFNMNRMIPWKWDETNIQKESQGIERAKQSIQYRVIHDLISRNNYDVIFDDDSSGEIADIISIYERGEKILVELYHCKYSHGDNPGARIIDLYEVCGQAEKSVRWCQSHSAIIEHMIKREAKRVQLGGTRFEIGNLRKLKEIKNKMRVFPTTFLIFIVQPGINASAMTDDMRRILAGTVSYLMDTYSINLQVICS